MPPGGPIELLPDASNLAGVIAELQDKHPDACRSWLEDMRTLSPDVETIRSVDRQDDHYRYVEVRFKNGYSGSSWTLSKGCCDRSPSPCWSTARRRRESSLSRSPRRDSIQQCTDTFWKSSEGENYRSSSHLIPPHSWRHQLWKISSGQQKTEGIELTCTTDSIPKGPQRNNWHISLT